MLKKVTLGGANTSNTENTNGISSVGAAKAGCQGEQSIILRTT